MFETDTLIVHGELVRFQISGKGNPLVLLHGFTENLELFRSTVDAFHSRAKIFLVDLPGHGGSGLPKKLNSIEDIADWLHDFLNQMGIQQFALVGHSLGGYIALAYSKKYPQTLKGICLAHSSPLPDSIEKKELRQKSIEFIMRNGSENFIRTLIPGLFSPESIQSIPEIVESSLKRALLTRKETLMRMIQIMKDRSDSTNWMAKTDIPIAGILGKMDGLIHYETVFPLMGIAPNVQVCGIEKVGHMGMLEDPIKFNAALSAFMNWVYDGNENEIPI